MPESTPPPLPPALVTMLAQLPDRALAGRLGKVYAAASHAIFRLGDMDLVKYETTVVDGSPDLSLWEEMAPVIRDTVVDVNALLSVIREHFPAQPAGGLADTLAQAIEEAGPFPAGSSVSRRASEAEQAIRAVGNSLAQQITHLGERMRSPAVVSDRWNLLSDLQTFRSKFRELIGDLVFMTASAFAEVGRKDVVPGYRDDVNVSVMTRSTVTDLTRLLGTRMEKVNAAEPEDIQWHAQQLEKELDMFGRTSAYRALRAQDKRTTIEFRHELGKMALLPTPSKRDLVDLLKPFVEFVGSLRKVNNREILIAHDRELWASCGVLLEQAEQTLGRDPAAAAEILHGAATAAQGLYGREAALDVFLRKVRKTPLTAVAGPALKQELDNFRELLSNLPMI